MPQLINGNGPQILTAGSALISAPAQSANGLELATMSNVKAQAQAQIISGTAQATTSGTFFDFGSIPVAVKRLTVMLSGVSTSSTSLPIVQLGTTAGLETTGYASSVVGGSPGSNISSSSSTAAFLCMAAFTAAYVISGTIMFTRVSGNSWVASGVVGTINGAVSYMTTGNKTLVGELDRLRLTTVNGTDTFDAGSVNILMEF